MGCLTNARHHQPPFCRVVLPIVCAAFHVTGAHEKIHHLLSQETSPSFGRFRGGVFLPMDTPKWAGVIECFTKIRCLTWYNHCYYPYHDDHDNHGNHCISKAIIIVIIILIIIFMIIINCYPERLLVIHLLLLVTMAYHRHL